MKIITQNKKAFHDYDILEKLEAGVVLSGDEVKSLRAGNANLVGAFATVHQGELFMINCYIGPYLHAYQKDEDYSRRNRKILIHRSQLNRLIGDIARKGITLIPLRLYFNAKNKVKIELGVCKHKKAHEKREELRERDIQRQTRRELKGTYDY